ncbi:hypothetical protein D910_09115 [Dendroctonus ponderosae]|uniref:DUF4774 domain-containing protein n=1 Tax=Dendroctonus ponderosae TaxID=77166 RepID=U4UP26_DENPD|nr:hypothetical protein D910_09115 [Dendroctonus ponderosae]
MPQPTSKPKSKPEKLETFTESNQPEYNTKIGELPQLNPGQRFFVLNGDSIYNFPFEAQQEIQDLSAFRYTNAQPFPQSPPKFVQPFAQEPPQYVQESGSPQAPVSVPEILLRNSFVNSDQQKAQPRPTFRTAQQYFRTGEAPSQLPLPGNIQDYFAEPQSFGRISQGRETVQPQLVGQFRFTPNGGQDFYQYRDDLENDAIVVDATFDAPQSSFDGRDSLRDEDAASSTSAAPPPAENEPEPSMAQAGPQATAIAGPGGVAGSAPRATAIVGKAGLAISSPQATAVAGTKEEERKKIPAKKD